MSTYSLPARLVRDGGRCEARRRNSLWELD